MLSLLGSLLGFGTSFLPSVMDFFKQKQADAHELAMMKEQRETQLAIGAQKLQAALVEAEAQEIIAAHREQESTVAKGGKFLAWLSGSIRPVVTYAFVIEFLAVTWSMAYLMLDQGGFTLETIDAINMEVLDEDYMGMLSAMIAFWFGNRTFGKRRA